jgi:ABC-type Fe3+-citrate transport system substrate-binding protein
MKPVTYNYNGKLNYPTDKTFVGIIAQDMQEIAPYTIKPLGGDNKENYLSFDGTPITFVLVNAIQEQQQKIDSQEKEIEKLKDQLNQMEELKAMVVSLAGQVEAITNDKSKTSKESEE